MNTPSFRMTWLPLILAALSLAILNLGLYTRLVAEPQTLAFSIPYQENFTSLTDIPYEEFGGDWEIRDQTLVQLSTSGYDLTSFIPLNIAAQQPYLFETTLRFLGGTMGGGILFNAQQTTNRQQSHMARFNVDAGQLWLIYGYFGDDSNFVGQGSIGLDIAPDNGDIHRLRLQVSDSVYALYLDDVQLVDNVPLYYQGGTVGFISATSQVAFDDVRVDVLIDETPIVQTENTPPVIDVTGTQELLFSDTFDNSAGGASLWQPISGEWAYIDGSLVQQQTENYDLSNIYQQPVNYPLVYQTTFRHQEAAGGGLLFNLPSANTKDGGFMVRYVDAGDVIAWGYFDEEGAFNGQGSAAVALPGTDAHTLEVRTDGQTYSIALDNVVLMRDIPMVNAVSPGYVGLTASQSAVAFDSVNLFTPVEQTTPPKTTANIDTEAASGNWIVADNVITQTAVEQTDYIAGTGLAGEQFIVSVEITLPPDNPEAGAGIVFHMDGRDDRRQGHMVRLGSGGQELFWGSYNEVGDFAGAGGITLEPQPTYKLLLIVHEDNFDIEVNGSLLVEAIPLQRSSGWIGLVSYSGPVTFSNVNLQLGE